jgi:hypothetical protein
MAPPGRLYARGARRPDAAAVVSCWAVCFHEALPREVRMSRLAGKVAVVTGGGSGIGRGIVLAMAKQGADIAIPDLHVLNADKVADEVKALGRKVLALKCDVTSAADVRTTRAWRRRPGCRSRTTPRRTGTAPSP